MHETSNSEGKSFLDDTANERGGVLRGWRLFFLAAFFVLFIVLLSKAISVLLLMFSGALIAVALCFIRDLLSRATRLPPRVSLTVTLLVVAIGGSIGLYLGAPTVVQQFQDLMSNMRDSLASLEGRIRESDLGSSLENWLDDMGENGGSGILSGVAGAFTTTFGAVSAFVLTLLVGVFLAYNPSMYISGALRLVPIPKRLRAKEILDDLHHTLRWWMAGQLISMVVLAVSTWLMLYLLGVSLAAPLGILTGVLTFIPYLGPIIALAPILLVAFAASPSLMLTVLILYLIIQNLEANVLMPIIFERTVELPPVLTIIAQVLLGALFGFIGIILATPLMAVAIRLVRMIYVEDILGDSMEKPAIASH